MPIPAGSPDWRPSLATVGALVPTRTRATSDDGYGADPGSGTFTAATTPTDTQVELLIDGAVGEITGKIGTVPAALYGLATRVAALGAAADVELSFPTGAETPNVAKSLTDRYDAALKDLIDAATRIANGQQLGPSEYLLPVGDFGDDSFPWPLPTLSTRRNI